MCSILGSGPRSGCLIFHRKDPAVWEGGASAQGRPPIFRLFSVQNATKKSKKSSIGTVGVLFGFTKEGIFGIFDDFSGILGVLVAYERKTDFFRLSIL